MNKFNQKIKARKINLPNFIRETLNSLAQKYFRTPKDEAICILSESLGKTPDKQVEYFFEIVEKLVENNQKKPVEKMAKK